MKSINYSLGIYSYRINKGYGPKYFFTEKVLLHFLCIRVLGFVAFLTNFSYNFLNLCSSQLMCLLSFN